MGLFGLVAMRARLKGWHGDGVMGAPVALTGV
jgi:hypothetical protein